VIRRQYAPNHAADFDFTRPPCNAAPRPALAEGDMLVRYLGAGGLYIEWRGTALLTAPFFSNPGLLRAAFGRLRWDEDAIRRGLQGLEVDRVRAVVAGHSHYDHVGDLPPLLPRLSGSARVYVNASGSNMLAACEGAEGRLERLEDLEREWVWLRDGSGARLAMRFMPLPSEHAGHLRYYHYARGEVREPWESCRWTDRRLRAMKEGRTFAFLIDLLAADLEQVAFRIHVQDAASRPPAGFPPSGLAPERPVDLAVVCLPGSWLVEGYPERLLERVRARHVLLAHYEDFFRPATKPLRFAPGLTDRRANAFLGRVQQEMSRGEHDAAGPEPCTCGPCCERWTMPLPGEWLRFKTSLAIPREA
jgi:hypothetical protein